MKKYYLDDFQSPQQYQQFIEYMVNNSDYFSLVYFSHHEAERTPAKIKEIAQALQPAKAASYQRNSWPHTVTLNRNNHVYRVILYRCIPEIIPCLCEREKVCAWDYPDAPMDLCFYRQGICWMASTAHEGDIWVYSDDDDVIQHIRSLGTNVYDHGSIDDEKLFRLENYKNKA